MTSFLIWYLSVEGSKKTAAILARRDEDSFRKLLDETQEMEDTAKKLLKVIKSCECKEHLKGMFNGAVQSKRHTLFMSRKVTKQDDLLLQTGLGPFSMKMGMKMVSCLDGYLHEIDYSDTISDYGSRKKYLFHVFVPEALIFALSKIHDLSCEKAEEQFRRLSDELI